MIDTTPTTTDLTYLDFDASLPCEPPWGDCDNEAEYLCRMQCCDASVLICTDCLAIVKRAMMDLSGQLYQCMFCKVGFIMNPDHVKVIRRLHGKD